MSKEKALKLINEYLAKQQPKKIELGIAADAVSSMFKSIEKIWRNAEDLVDEFEKNKKKAQRQIQSVQKSFDKAENIYKNINRELTQKAGELDIAPNKIPDFDKIQKTYSFLKRKKDDIISLLKKYA